MWLDLYERVVRQHCRFVDADSPLDPDTPMTQLGIDSMEIVNLIIDLEDSFEFAIPDDLLAPEVFITPGTLWKALADRFDLSN
jgi:acyl carrier protein